MANQIDDYVKRPFLYQHIDGLGELLIGFLWIVLPLLEFFNKTAASGSIWHRGITFYVCSAAITVAFLYGHTILKKHITFPRTGYVKYREARKRGRLIAGMVVVFALVLSIDYVVERFASHSYETTTIAWTSAGWGLLYVILTRMNAAWRWVVLLALLVVPPAATMLFPVGRFWSGTFPFVLQGLIFAISGTIALTLYLRRNPVPEQVAE